MRRLKNSYQFIPEPNNTGCTNQLANNYNGGDIIDDGSCTFDPQDITAIISDPLFDTHGVLVKFQFDLYYEGDNAKVYNNTDEDLFEFAKGIGTTLIIKSWSGIYSHIPLATSYYGDGILMCMTLGSNQNIELTNPPTLSVIVSCGAGNSTAIQNQTGYGNGLEFWDNESINSVNAESSFSNPIVAAKLLTIKEARDCTWWEARYVARYTADRNEPNRPANTIWHNLNGFGKINVANAIAYNGSIPADPYLNNTNVYTPFTP